MKLDELVKYIRRVAIVADGNISTTLMSESLSFQSLLKQQAPVDKGDFKDSWKVSPVEKKGGDKELIISNDKAYAPAIEFGSAPGESPWPSPGEKTVMSSGRIFSTQAVGGTIEDTFNKDNVNKFAIEIANSILRAFK